MTVNAALKNLRVTFLVPGLTSVLRFYVGLMLDLKDVPKHVKAQLDSRLSNL